MKLPWQEDEEKIERIKQLEAKVEELREEKQSWKNRFQAEKDRRSELSRKKQEAEEKAAKLEDKLESIKSEDEEEDEETHSAEARALSFQEGKRILEKLASVESPEKDLVTVKSPEKVTELGDYQGLKNAVEKEKLNRLQKEESFLAFLDRDVFSLILKTRPFFESDWKLGESFSTEKVLEFIEEQKTWALVSAGETKIFREESGEVEELDSLKSRVNREHSKGGFSQDRFERKREEQIQDHLEEVEDKLAEFENIYLLGEKKLCKELPGTHLGGFDPNKSALENFYSFRLVEF